MNMLFSFLSVSGLLEAVLARIYFSRGFSKLRALSAGDGAIITGASAVTPGGGPHCLIMTTRKLVERRKKKKKALYV